MAIVQDDSAARPGSDPWTLPTSAPLAAPTDPLLSGQWHLTSAAAGINVLGAWRTYTGEGVVVGIIDNGIDYNQPDLRPRYAFGRDYDVRDRDEDAYSSAGGETHATNVAGVIAAANNGVGTVGVAYNASIAGFRIGYGRDGSSSQNADALARVAAVDVANASWGYPTPFTDNFRTASFASWGDALRIDAATGRHGLGTVIVAAAGNTRSAGDDVNYHNFGNSPYVIAVAATEANGRVASYSNPGAALLVSAPGTGILTTDRPNVYSSQSGTSFAAPAVTGVVALMLEANPGLGYRDVQEILAYSARQTDAGSAGWAFDHARDWNGGGLHFSQDYGFGLVDATAAVRLAESWQARSTYANLVVQKASQPVGGAIPDGSATGIRSEIALASPLTVDRVEVDLNISHGRVGDLVVTLTSPSGTRAVLIDHPANGTGGGIVFTTSANNFWGEDAEGTWTLTVADTAGGAAGRLNSWSIRALGDAPSADDTYVYTDEFASVWNAARATLADAGGTDMLNLAAVSGSVALDLRPGMTSLVAGKALTIGAPTVIENAWLGDGDDYVVGNEAGNLIQGGRGDDTIVGLGGDDILYGGPGSDSFAILALDGSTDVIKDFTVGEDHLDLRALFTAYGYRGADPVADGWLALALGAGGTDLLVDPHAGQGWVKLATLETVWPAMLTAGGDYLFA